MRNAILGCLTLSLVLGLSACGPRADRDDRGGANGARYSWQRPHAEVLPSGDLAWKPEPFVFRTGQRVRYIDFENGDDAASGTSPAEAWKHHPWDANAAANAAAAEGVDTYVFRRGVVYRGTLVADESGSAETPIRLTSSPRWGEGTAWLYGSMAVSDGWQRLTAEQAPPDMPEPEKVWTIDLPEGSFPRLVWLAEGDAITRIPLARDPNWTVSDEHDIRSEWYTWASTERVMVPNDQGNEQARALAADPEHLTAEDPDAYVGGTVWTEYTGVMATPYPSRVEAYDPQAGAVRIGGPWGDTARYMPIANNRWFIENLPRLLDAPGEYWFDETTGRLYLRLPDDRDPNTAVVEIGERMAAIDIADQSHIHVTGLGFRFTNTAHWYDRWWTLPAEDAATVRVLGSCDDIRVSHCTFEHIAMAVRAQSLEGTMGHVAVTDNDIRWTDYGAIDLTRAREGEFARGEVLRNRLYQIGLRPMRAHHGHAVKVGFVTLAEIAGNMLDRGYGAGLFIFGGKGGGPGVRPLSRILMHHNRVTDSMLNTNDWGGIESWQGGPTYIYNNVSGNPGGYWHWKHLANPDPAQRDAETPRFGFAYYLDGAFKQYVFNNIAWGLESDVASPLANTAAIQEVLGMMNAIFNNTFYNFAIGSRRQSRANRNYYIGNAMLEIGYRYFQHPMPDGESLETFAYSHNVLAGEPRQVGLLIDNEHVFHTLGGMRMELFRRQALAREVGWEVQGPTVVDAANHDFRPAEGSELTDRGVKFFVPWGLYATVGEWHFTKHPANPQTIFGESWFMTEEHVNRGMYADIPRHDLQAHNVGRFDYVAGELEDWTEGALRLNGIDQYCTLSHADMTADAAYGEDQTLPGAERPTLDMDTNDFLIEAYLRVAPGNIGVIASKADLVGYVLDIDDQGRPRLTLWVDGLVAARRSARVAINDGTFHHVLAEVSRSDPDGITLYVDGQVSNGPLVGPLPDPAVSLSNDADFLVGRGRRDGDFLAGELDFLRVCRGTLADAQTTIEELYAWQFAGPFLRDFAGNAPTGAARDAGALEGRP